MLTTPDGTGTGTLTDTEAVTTPSRLLGFHSTTGVKPKKAASNFKWQNVTIPVKCVYQKTTVTHSFNLAFSRVHLSGTLHLSNLWWQIPVADCSPFKEPNFLIPATYFTKMFCSSVWNKSFSSFFSVWCMFPFARSKWNVKKILTLPLACKCHYLDNCMYRVEKNMLLRSSKEQFITTEI